MIEIENIIVALNSFDSSQEDVVKILPEDTSTDSQGIIFLKPELCSLSPKNLRLILSYFLNLAKKHDIEVHDIFIVSGNFIINEKIYDKNYDNIRRNSLCNLQVDRISHLNLLKVIEKTENCQLVIGGIALAEKGYAPKFILDLWLNSGKAFKIDDDFYGVPCLLEGKKILLINGFYPAQAEQYKVPNSKIILFSFKTEKSFSFLKKYFQGTAEIQGRYKGSMRQHLYENRNKYQLDSFSPSRNGIHLSGNREEGQREVTLFREAIQSYFNHRQAQK
ncbi:MAG: hypothetical protein JNJ47_04150 [Alphaproteobacteria bacterium]|nr:hypothetical protein [Alphaproteobacteria bacterium]